MILGNGFIPMFVSGMQWTGATWAVSGGNAYNTPTLGAELLTNGGMEAGASSPIVSYGLVNAITFPADERTGGSGTRSVEIANTAVGFGGMLQDVTVPIGGWVFLEGWQKKVTANALLKLTTTAYATLAQGAVVSSLSWTKNRCVTRATETTIRAFSQNGTNVIGDSHRTDDLSMKVAATPTLFATVAGASSNQATDAKIATLTTGTQAGIVSLLDSPSNPQNFLIAYHDGTNVRLDKCVAGVYTNLITVVVSFVSNARIEIRRPTGNSFELWYNGIQRGTTQTVNDAGIINNTRYGLFSTFNGNTFSEFTLGGIIIPFNLPGV